MQENDAFSFTKMDALFVCFQQMTVFRSFSVLAPIFLQEIRNGP